MASPPPPAAPPREAPPREPAPLHWIDWLALLYAGLALPVICHVLTSEGPPEVATWQSGDLGDKLSFALGPRVGFILYPAMLYPMTCLGLLLLAERRFARRGWVRFGIYTGVPVAIWYGALLLLGPLDLTGHAERVVAGLLMAASGPFVVFLARLVWWGLSEAARRELGLTLGLIAVSALGGAVGLAFQPELIALPIFLSLVGAPFWTLAAYFVVAMRLVRHFPRRSFRIGYLFGAFAWLAAFLAACRQAVLWSLEEYSRLPVEVPPSCYVATAAARGHARFVRAEPRRLTDGRWWQANRQLRVLKAFELALRTLCPFAHRALRRIYDRVGPALASGLRNVWLADAAHLTLKPAEWLAAATLRVLLGRGYQAVEALYGDATWDEAPGTQGTKWT